MKKGYTHVSILIDRSGSMQSIKKDVIGGFNQLLEDQKKEDGELTLSLTQFDDNFGSLCFENTNDFAPLNEVKKLDESNYVPRGSTPLNDALAKLINETGIRFAKMSESQRPEKVMMVIMTDGEENCSKEHTKDSVKKLIEHQEQKYGWKFIYIGANQDSFAESSTRGMNAGMNFDANKIGTKSAFYAASNVLRKSRKADLQSYATMDFAPDMEADYEASVKLETEKEKQGKYTLK